MTGRDRSAAKFGEPTAGPEEASSIRQPGSPMHSAATRDDAQYQFDFSRYHQAVQIREELAREANEAQERLEEANAALAEIEAKLGQSWEMAKAAVRLRAKEAAGVR